MSESIAPENTDNKPGRKAASGLAKSPASAGKSVLPDGEAAADESRLHLASIHLVHEVPPPECSFWIGFNRPGSLSPGDLLKTNDVGTILRQSADSGTNEPGHLLLTDTQSDPAKYFLLVPKPEAGKEELAIWRDDLLSSMRAWNPDPIGIYLADQDISADMQSEIIQMLVQAVFLQTECRKIFLLCGPHGLNFLLSIALEARGALAPIGLDVDVFH